MGLHTIERRLGRCPSPEQAVKRRIQLADVADISWILKQMPQGDFGHEMVIPAKGWGMNLNDKIGDCAVAGPYHEHKLWNAVTGTPFSYTDTQVRNTYKVVGDYDPKQTDEQGNNPTDNGCDMARVASYRRKTGLLDTKGKRHKIDAYVALEPGNWEQFRVCMWLFGAAGLGMIFYNANWDQYLAGKPWDYDPKSGQDGGHYVPGVGDRQQNISTVTWGSLQGMTRRCYDKQVDEALGYVSKEYILKGGKTPEGFDFNALMTAVANVTRVSEPAA